MMGAVSTGTVPCTVDFRITVPRGRVMAAAARSPSGWPVASTTQSYSATGKSPDGHLDGDAAAFRDAQLLFVPAELVDLVAVGVEHLRDQQAQLAVSQHRYPGARRNRDLVQDLAGGGQRLGEDGALGREAIGRARADCVPAG